MTPTREDVLDWLLADAADPAVRWQVLRDLAAAPTSRWRAQRARVATEGWGAALLSHQDEDGQWAGGAHFPSDHVWGGDEPGQPWTSTSHQLTLLRRFGLDPTTDAATRTVELVGANCVWEHDAQPYWEGEVEPCINGQLVANGTHFGVDMTPVVDRLLSERLDDGGWNCEVENGATVSSFDTTTNVVEGLLAHEQAVGGDAAVAAARHGGEEYLLQRGLFRRRTTGEVADDGFLTLTHPERWHHTVLRGLDHFRAAGRWDGTPPDPRLGEAVEWLRSRRRDDGTWPLERVLAGRTWFEMEVVGAPSRWMTLLALRVLDWWDGAYPAGPPSTGNR